MSYDVELAKMFKKNENPAIDESAIGTIISLAPIKVSIYDGKIILKPNQCYICESLKTIKGSIVLDYIEKHGTVTTTFTISRNLSEGDRVMCVPTAKGNKYFIVDKVV